MEQLIITVIAVASPLKCGRYFLLKTVLIFQSTERGSTTLEWVLKKK